MDLRKLESGRIEALSELMLKAAAHIPAERTAWRPEGLGRSPQELLAHTAGANLAFARLIQGETELPGEPPQQIKAEARSYQEALQTFQTSAQTLAQAMRILPEERFTQECQMPWGERWKMTRVLSAPSAHIAYHWGQLCYLQTLLGDQEDRH
ncbi:MAG TPA: DinB family protein [Candidatus Fraserbacteria bacterium]|nr:DinB family protein [Candidatus Fraserbacteria bacterium]